MAKIKKTIGKSQSATIATGINWFLARLTASALTAFLMVRGATAGVPLNETQVLDFKIASSGMTRISIKGDSIKDVYALTEEGSVTRHESGHVFVTPSEDYEVIYVTLITGHGLAQDMRLTPVPKKAEPILLEYVKPEPSREEAKALEHEQASILIADFIQGNIPAGFYAVKLPASSRGKDNHKVSLVNTWQNAQYRALVFSLENIGSEEIVLQSRQYWSSTDLAIAFDRSVLSSGQTAKLYVIQRY